MHNFRACIAPLHRVVVLLFLVWCGAFAQETPPSAPVIGPAAGSLVIVGGGDLDESIRREFLELAGGVGSPIVVIPTASGLAEYNDSTGGLGAWRELGVTDVAMVHTTDRAVADSDAFVAPITRAKGVWLGGGRQWRLADAYLGTKTEHELWALLERGGVIGGTSAGATIQGSYLARGDTAGNTVMMGDHEAGFGFVKNVAIDQHVLRRNRQFDLIEIVRAKPELLGIGIDENTAIVVQGDGFRVIGAGYVVIHDASARLAEAPKGVETPFYFLAPGDRFDLRSRTPERPNPRSQPFERVTRDGDVGER